MPDDRDTKRPPPLVVRPVPRVPTQRGPLPVIEVPIEFDPEEPDTGQRSAESLFEQLGEERRARLAAETKLAEKLRNEHAERIASEAKSRKELSEYPEAVRVQYGGAKVAVPTAVLTALATAIVVAYLDHKPPSPVPAQPDCVSKEEFSRYVQVTNERVMPLETRVEFLMLTKSAK